MDGIRPARLGAHNFKHTSPPTACRSDHASNGRRHRPIPAVFFFRLLLLFFSISKIGDGAGLAGPHKFLGD